MTDKYRDAKLLEHHIPDNSEGYVLPGRRSETALSNAPDDHFKELREAYGLRCIAMSVYSSRVHVFLNREQSSGDDDCVFGFGSTFNEAFQNALLEFDRFGLPCRPIMQSKGAEAGPLSEDILRRSAAIAMDKLNVAGLLHPTRPSSEKFVRDLAKAILDEAMIGEASTHCYPPSH
ncbi:hypothetical protein JP75_08165 [Devosia riboflavina]|uniref:Uncharacterized protein n=1 Tax=Devosia riboflavina TaxID=46914 RepID=A0A087M3P7_9HYPH|nr:hypothetical protein [Devosia riboflavina]KFL31500.1 hypothetical protein JP75_08165 [Devosia riboflavina]